MLESEDICSPGHRSFLIEPNPGNATERSEATSVHRQVGLRAVSRPTILQLHDDLLDEIRTLRHGRPSLQRRIDGMSRIGVENLPKAAKVCEQIRKRFKAERAGHREHLRAVPLETHRLEVYARHTLEELELCVVERSCVEVGVAPGAVAHHDDDLGTGLGHSFQSGDKDEGRGEERRRKAWHRLRPRLPPVEDGRQDGRSCLRPSGRPPKLATKSAGDLARIATGSPPDWTPLPHRPSLVVERPTVLVFEAVELGLDRALDERRHGQAG